MSWYAPRASAVLYLCATFTLDLMTPLGYADWLAYPLALPFLARWLTARELRLFAAASTVLVILGFFLSPPGVTPFVAALNRIVLLLILYLMVNETITMKESERRFRAIFNSAGVGIHETAENERFVAVNDTLLDILGYTRQEILAMDVTALTVPEDREITGKMNRMVSNGESDHVAYDKRYLKRDGTPLWVHVNLAGVRGANGDWIRSITTVEDITERKKVEQDAHDSREKLEEQTKLLEYAPVLVRDMQDRITLWNTGMQSLYGFSAEEAIGRVSHDLL